MRKAGHILFGPFDLDLEAGELRHSGVTIKLSPKPLQLLALLADSPGRLFSRDMIREELWGAGTHLDFEHALNFCIREIRVALGDSAREPHFIQTLPRRGYRFIAETTVTSRPLAAVPLAVSHGAGTEPELEAYQYYDRARRSLGLFRKESLDLARQDFQRAVEISPKYAMAHSGLGASYALCSLNRRHPSDLNAALTHLTRALELDPELAEPYPWLCFVFMRKNQLERAIEAGLRGVHLQPDLVHAHYFLGLAHFAAAEQDAANYQSAVRHLQNAGRVGPHWQPTWFVLSYAALLTGNYNYAEQYAGRLMEMSSEPKGMPFIGAEIVLASIRLRLGDPAGARSLLTEFFRRMTDSDHTYRDAMSVAAGCVLGDVELRHGDSRDALAAYRRAWHALQESPRIMAYQRTAARAQSGLAAAYAATGDRARAADLLSRALETARESEMPEYNAATASLTEVYWAIAVGWARLGDPQQTIEALKSAVRTGWLDTKWMERDPELESVRRDSRFAELLAGIRGVSQVRFDISRS